MKKNLLLCLAAASAVTLVAVAAVGSNSLRGILAAEGPCEHVGRHYSAAGPTNNNDGHYEFWSCCKCHASFTTETEGNWTDADFADVIGWNSDHPAYIAPLGTLDKQYVDHYVWSDDDSTFVANTANAQLSLPTLPNGSSFVSASVGGVALEGASVSDGKLVVPASDYTKVTGDTNVSVTMKLGGSNYVFNVPTYIVTAELNNAKQFSFIRWTNKANSGTTNTGVVNPFLVESGSKYSIQGTFVSNFDFNVGGGTVNENSGDIAFTGSVTSSGWDDAKGFRGTFDGQGHKFDDVTFISAGLFGSLGSGATVKNFDITCSNGYSTLVNNGQPNSCMIAAQAFKARIENINVVSYGAHTQASAGKQSAVFIGDMVSNSSVIKDVYIKQRIGAANIFGTRTKSTGVTYENVTVEIFKQWSSDTLTGVTAFYGGYSDSYPAGTTAPAGVTLK